MSLKDKVDGNELDLSLNQLTEVPVKELAAATKATMLDLSCNRIRSLPREFSTLTHLIKIDLSSNSLVELPDNFGNLHNLQYLDLYSNQLVTLPTSFSRLKNLRWLDLKNNPLEGKLKAVAGDCLCEKECQACAKKVVAFMQTVDSELEREKQKKLKAIREEEAIKKANMEKELEEQRRLKKLEREKRKAESKAKKEHQLSLEKELLDMDHNNSRLDNMDNINESELSSSGGKYFFAKILAFLLVIVFSFLLAYYVWNNKLSSVSSCDLSNSIFQIQLKMKSYLVHSSKFIKHYYPVFRDLLLKIVHQYIVVMTHFASKLEQMLSIYFQ